MSQAKFEVKSVLFYICLQVVFNSRGKTTILYFSPIPYTVLLWNSAHIISIIQGTSFACQKNLWCHNIFLTSFLFEKCGKMYFLNKSYQCFCRTHRWRHKYSGNIQETSRKYSKQKNIKKSNRKKLHGFYQRFKKVINRNIQVLPLPPSHHPQFPRTCRAESTKILLSFVGIHF